MQRRTLLHSLTAITAAAVLPAPAATKPQAAPKDAFLKDFLERWETSHQYTLAVAEAMPDNGYDFKPTPEEMTFAEQLMHMAFVMDWHAFAKADGQEFKPRRDAYKPEGLSKQQIIGVLDKEFGRVTKLLNEYDPAKLEQTSTYINFTRTRRQFFMLLTDHVTHHRAQLLVYLRLKGIVPPKYVEFQ
ncbi:hypothetical protein GCM10023187_43890 [Nibrella viscosa]|uniref:DinB-like domain-containing protein n=1 Tax=Nibrella viscosa TaxID=1084524 RepID=A0ABP8KRI4_9BACT